MNNYFFSLIIYTLVSVNCFSQQQEEISADDVSKKTYADIIQWVQNNRDNNVNINVLNTLAYYIESDAILLMHKALLEITNADVPVYNGININFATHEFRLKPSDRSDYQSRVGFTAAKKINDSTINRYYGVFESFYNSLPTSEKQKFNRPGLSKGVSCPGYCDSAIIRWLNLYIGKGDWLKQKPSLYGNFKKPIDLLFSSESELVDVMKRHKTVHENEYKDQNGKPAQTLSVFMEADKIENLADFINSGTGAYPVCAMYFMSYNQPESRIGMANEKQTTVIFVPMKFQNGYLIPVIEEYVSFSKKNKFVPFDTENHGTLCPNVCPPN
jgi:hypothetical protein